MPLALILVGIVLLIVGARGSQRQFATLLREDFSGQGSFLYWIAALGILGALGYWKPTRAFSRGFILLLLLGMVLANGGIFDRLTAAIANPPPLSAPSPDPTAGAGQGGGGGAGGGAGGGLQGVSNVVGGASRLLRRLF